MVDAIKIIKMIKPISFSAVEDVGFEMFCLSQPMLSASMVNTVYVINYLITMPIYFMILPQKVDFNYF